MRNTRLEVFCQTFGNVELCYLDVVITDEKGRECRGDNICSGSRAYCEGTKSQYFIDEHGNVVEKRKPNPKKWGWK